MTILADLTCVRSPCVGVGGGVDLYPAVQPPVRSPEVAVSEDEAAWLGHARARFANIRDAISAIGPPAFWSGESYYARFLPAQEDLLALAEEGNRELALGSPARAQFASLVNQANNLVLRVQNGSLSYDTLAAWFSSNPLDRWRLVTTAASRVVEGASDAGAAAREAAPDYLAGVLAAIRKYALYLGVGGVGLYLLSRSR